MGNIINITIEPENIIVTACFRCREVLAGAFPLKDYHCPGCGANTAFQVSALETPPPVKTEEANRAEASLVVVHASPQPQRGHLGAPREPASRVDSVDTVNPVPRSDRAPPAGVADRHFIGAAELQPGAPAPSAPLEPEVKRTSPRRLVHETTVCVKMTEGQQTAVTVERRTSLVLDSVSDQQGPPTVRDSRTAKVADMRQDFEKLGLA